MEDYGRSICRLRKPRWQRLRIVACSWSWWVVVLSALGRSPSLIRAQRNASAPVCQTAATSTSSPTTNRQNHQHTLPVVVGVEDLWHGLTEDDIWNKTLHCDQYYHADADRPIHNESTWMMLRGVYQGVVGPHVSSIAQPLSTTNGFFVDYQVKHSPGRGRGVFAAQDIHKGQLVYTETMQKATFSTGHNYRRFLQSLPPDLACDVMEWAYVQQVDQGLIICVDLDEGALLNDGRKQETNIGCDPEAAAKLNGHVCGVSDFALRDIQKGEELLVAYDDFDAPDGWSSFGL